MKYKIGVFGSAVSGSAPVQRKAALIGKELAQRNCIVITGACSGLPYAAAYEAAQNNAEIWGFSPEANFKGQLKFTPNNNNSIYKKLFYTPKSLPKFSNGQVRKKFRNVMSTATCDAGIIIAGRWGTLNEVTNLYDMGKVIGVLTGSGGIAEELSKLDKKIHKPSHAKFIFSSSPKTLVQSIIKELKKQ